jgi:hypothetical protein
MALVATFDTACFLGAVLPKSLVAEDLVRRRHLPIPEMHNQGEGHCSTKKLWKMIKRKQIAVPR